MRALVVAAATAVALATASTSADAQVVVPEGDPRSQLPPVEPRRWHGNQPPVLDDRGGDPPPGWRRDRWTHSSWWIAGTVMMTLGYGFAVVAGVRPPAERRWDVGLLPLVGPVWLLADAGSRSPIEPITVVTGTLVGALQFAGTALIAAGLLVPRRVFVPILPTIRINATADRGSEYGVGVSIMW